MRKPGFISALSLTTSMAACLAASSAFAAPLSVICSNDQAWCDLMVSSFEQASGIDVDMVRKSTGETLAQVRAEAGNPKTDVRWGGTGEPHLVAASEGLTVASGVDTSGLLGWAQNIAEVSGGKTIGIQSGALGIAYNSDLLAEKKMTAPACWKDLAKKDYAGEIQAANPNSSGTAYTELATLVQLFGEDEGFKLLAEIGANVNQYTKSGSAPSKAAARGETTISIGFMQDMIKLQKEGFPLVIVSPCEGTGYEVGAVSVIAGTKNMEAATKWVEYVLSAPAQTLALQVGAFAFPSNPSAEVAPEAQSMSSMKLIDYDFATFGSSAMREKLLARWEAEVKNAGGTIEK